MYLCAVRVPPTVTNTGTKKRKEKTGRSVRCGCVPDSRTLAHQRSLLATVGWLELELQWVAEVPHSQSVWWHICIPTIIRPYLILAYPTLPHSATDIEYLLYGYALGVWRARGLCKLCFIARLMLVAAFLPTPPALPYIRESISATPSRYLYSILYIHDRVNIYSTYHSRERARERDAGHCERGHNSKHIARVVSKRLPRSPSCSFMARVRCH